MGVSFGRSLRLSLPKPMAMAPEETRMISCPMFFRSLSTLQKRSMRWMFSRPVACASVEVPTLTTIRIKYPSDRNAAVSAADLEFAPYYTAPFFILHLFFHIFCAALTR